MKWLFSKMQKKEPPLDSSTSIPPTSEPPLPPIPLLDEQKTKITFSASLVSANSIPSTNGVSNSNGREVQVAQNTYSGSIYRTGAGFKIPDPVAEPISRKTYSTHEMMLGMHLTPRKPLSTRSRSDNNQNKASEKPETNDKNNSDPVADVSQPNFDLKSTTILASEEERARRELEEKARLAAEAKARREEEERVRQEEEEKARLAEAERARLAAEAERAQERARLAAEAADAAAERARLAKVTQVNVTSMDKTDEQEQEILLNKLCNDILDNLDAEGIAEDLKNRIIKELLEDFSSNQNYTTNDTTNTTNAISSNNTKDSTSEKQILTAPKLETLSLEKYTARLTPKTYFGVGIQTELVQEENQKSYLNITQFYDDSGFKSALEEKDSTIKNDDQKIKITAIECDLDGNGTKAYYSIDQIFEKCEKNEMNFNLKLCAIFRNLNENELKLKFSIEGGLQDQDLNIKKSVFTKGENNEEYKNIKTVIKQQTVIRKQNQAQPSVYPSYPQNGGRPADIAITVVA